MSDPLAEACLRRHAFRRPQLRVGEGAGVGVRFQEPVVERGQIGQQDIRLGQVAQLAERHPLIVWYEVCAHLPSDGNKHAIHV